MIWGAYRNNAAFLASRACVNVCLQPTAIHVVWKRPLPHHDPPPHPISPYLQDPTKGKESFARAKEASGLTAGLTGALGKRTKFQQSQIAQLVLVASSATPVVDADADADTGIAAKSGDAGGLPPPVPPPGASGEQGTGETGLSSVTSGDSSGGGGGDGGKRGDGNGEVGNDVAAAAAVAGPELGMSTAVGEEGRRAAARQTVHAEDSALLEDISFVERDLEKPGKLQVRCCVCVCVCMCAILTLTI